MGAEIQREPIRFHTIGLDMSLSGTGFCKLTGPLITLETIKTKPREYASDLDRLMYITDKVLTMIPPETKLICIEDFYVPASRQQFGAAINLVGLGTLMRIKLYESGLPFAVVAPSQLKKFVVGKGNANKNLVLREVFKRWSVDAKDDNQADACTLAKLSLAIIEKLTSDKAFPKFQEEVISKVINDRPKYNCDSLLQSGA